MNPREKSFLSSVQDQYLLLVLQLAFPLIIATLLVKEYGVDIYGRFSPLLVVCSVLANIIDCGSTYFAPERFKRKYPTEKNSYEFSALMLQRLILAIVFMALAPFFVGFLIPYIYPGYSFAMMACAALGAILSAQAKLYALENTRGFVKISLYSRVVACFAIYFIAQNKIDPKTIIAMYIATPLTVAVITADIIALREPINKKLFHNAVLSIKKTYAHGLAAISGNLVLQIPNLIAGVILNPTQVGAFHLANVAVRGATSLAEPIGIAGYAALYGREKIGILGHSRRRMQRIQIIISAISSLALFGAGLVISKISVEKYSGYREAGELIVILSGLPVVVTVATMYMLWWISVHPKTIFHMKVNVAGVLVLTFGCIIGAHISGGKGIASAVLIYEGVVAMVYMMAVQRMRYVYDR